MRRKIILVVLSLMVCLMAMPIVASAAVGDRLTAPGTGWKRIDDKHPLFLYSSGVTNNVHAQHYGGSDSVIWPHETVTFEFTGTKLRVIAARWNNKSTANKITLDGVESTFSAYTTSTIDQSQIVVYERTNLADTWHRATITVPSGNGTNLEFDAIDIDANASFGDTTAPSAPVGLTVDPSDGTAVLTWSAVTASDLIGYNVYVDGVKVNTSPITSTNYTVSVPNNIMHSYQVTALDDYRNESVRSQTVTAIFDTISPLAPIGLASNPSADGQTMLTWTPNTEPDIAGYNVYQDGVKRNGPLIIPPEYLVTGLANNVTYSFTVTAVDTSGNASPQSQAVTYFLDASAPEPPTGLTGTATTSTVDLSWVASTDPDVVGYNIYRNGVKLNSSLVTDTTFVASGLAPGTSHNFTVRAVDDANNESVNSNMFSISTEDVPETVPQNVKAQSGNGMVTLTWGAIAGATEYRIYRDGALIATETGTSYQDTAVTNDTLYLYRVSAVIDGVEGELSEERKARPGNFAAFDPNGLSVSVMDAIGTGFSFLAKYSLYVLIVLGIIFAPLIIGMLQWLFNKIRKTPEKKPTAKRERKQLTPEEKERRARERKLNKARDEKYDYLTRTGRTTERDAWVKQTGYLNKEQRQERARQERTRAAREARDGRQAVWRSTGERDSHGNRIRRKEYVGREPRNGR